MSVVFNKKFRNNAILKLQARRVIFNATIRPGESTEEYAPCFSEAEWLNNTINYPMKNTTISDDAFLTGFPKSSKHKLILYYIVTIWIMIVGY